MHKDRVPDEKPLRWIEIPNLSKEASSLGRVNRPYPRWATRLRLRQFTPEEVPAVVKLTGLDLDRLVAGFRAALERRLEQIAEEPAPLGPRVTQADRIAAIDQALSSARTLPFERLLEDCLCVEDVIVTFLAVLELLKQARIRVWQLAAFGAIVLSR